MRKVPFCAEVEVRFFPSSLVKNDLENRKIQSLVQDSLCADRAKIGGKNIDVLAILWYNRIRNVSFCEKGCREEETLEEKHD